MSGDQCVHKLCQQHQQILDVCDEFSAVIDNLYYEGPALLEKNIIALKSILIYFQCHFFPHVCVDEEAIFPFLSRHVPKLEPVIGFLNAEHQELRDSFTSLQGILRNLVQAQDRNTREKEIHAFRQKGIYFACLLRNHLQAEKSCVYHSILSELNGDELDQFVQLVEISQIQKDEL